MFKKLLIVTSAVLMMTSLSNAKEVAGINMPDSLEIGQNRLLLNGVGVRTKFFIRLYLGALYLGQKSHDPEKIIKADKPMAIRMHIISSLITSEKMEETTREGFVKATGGNIAPIKDQIERFISEFKDEIKKNDIYDFIYVPGKGIEVYKNNEFKSLTKGLSFKQALFGIWLCDNPAQNSLKKEMLGK